MIPTNEKRTVIKFMQKKLRHLGTSPLPYFQTALIWRP